MDNKTKDVNIERKIGWDQIYMEWKLFGPVALGTNRCGKDLPALLGCAEEGLDEAPTLGGLQDGIPMYQQACSKSST